WDQFGRILKEGYTDYSNKDKIADLFRFNSSKCKDKDELIDLKTYVERLVKNQDEIYFLSGPSRQDLDNNPILEIFKKNNIEVLYCYDPVDEFVLPGLFEYKKKKIVSADQADLSKIEKLSTQEEKKKEVSRAKRQDLEKLTRRMKNILGDKVEDVILSDRLIDSPALLAGTDMHMSKQMEKIMQMVNREVKPIPKKMEINKNHPLINKMLTIYKTDPKDALLTKLVHNLYTSVLLLDGNITDTHEMVDNLQILLKETANLYTKQGEDNILQILITWLKDAGLSILFIIVGTFILIRMINYLSDRIFASVRDKKKDDVEFGKRSDTLNSIFRNVWTILICSIAVIIILGELGIDIGPILAAAGILGLAVGFGAQSLVKDLIRGFFILIEDQYRVGDVVQIEDKAGVVEKMTLKLTILRDLAGNVHHIPNGEINVVTNMTKGYSRYLFEIGVAYRENVDEVMKIMKKVDEELRADPEYTDDIIEPLEIFGLDQFADSALIIKARITTKPIKQWRIGREYNRRLKKAFDKNNIEIPFPHLTLYAGKDKKDQSPPLNIKLNK
ncbi:MAG: mechanosensitive ion channel, partial [bacterium]